MMPPPSSNSSGTSDPSKQQARLERLWLDKFSRQPALPTAALLSGALAMALGFCAALFLLSAALRPRAWIWIVLATLCGLLNRWLARRWYRRVVVPWDHERRAVAEELNRLRGPSPPTAYLSGETLPNADCQLPIEQQTATATTDALN
jgi:hypothetical protein